MAQLIIGGLKSLILNFDAAELTVPDAAVEQQQPSLTVSQVQKRLTTHGLPASATRLTMSGKPLADTDRVPSDAVLQCVVRGGLKGGKGGFGAMLRAQGKMSRQKRVENFGACRDLNGRRLRHVNDELRLRKWLSDAETTKRNKMGKEYKEPAGRDGLEGWFLNVPSWAEGYKSGKPVTEGFMTSRRKTVLCREWRRARLERGEAPKGAPSWWGCPRGRECTYAHGDDELRGQARHDAAVASKAAKESADEDILTKFETAKADIHGSMASAIAMGLSSAKSLKRRKEEAEKAKKASFLPVDLAGSRSGLRWDGAGWLISLNVDTDVSIRYPSSDPVGPGAAGAGAGAGAGAAATDAAPLRPGEAEVTGVAEFGTCKVGGIALTSGAWYYEVELLTDGLLQIGWADAGFESSSSAGDGVGDHTSSWAYDGARQLRWNGEDPQAYGAVWGVGDVIGCLVDIDAGSIAFTLNGEPQGVAYKDVPLASSGGVYPGLSLNAGEVAVVNLGQAPFRFAPDAPYLGVFASRLGDAGLTAGAGAGAGASSSAVGEGAGDGVGAPPLKKRKPVASAPAAATKTATTPAPVAPAPVPLPVSSPASAPAPAPAPAPPAMTPEEAAEKASVSLPDTNSVDELEALGLEQLKAELMARGLKCGGNLKQRAERLWTVKGLTSIDDVPKKLRAKVFPGPLWA